MKKVILLASIIASAFVLASCSCKDMNQGPVVGAPEATPVAQHRDLKGEGAIK